MFHLIARIVEALTTSPATRASRAHAQRKAQRKARETAMHYTAQAQRSMRDRNEYPFHA